jgi:hypothetical protein
MLRVSRWFTEADEYVIQYILPVLAHKSDTLRKILEETNGMKNLFLSAKTDCSDPAKNYNAASKKTDEQAALIKELSEELTTRAKLCGLKCRFIKEAGGRETERNLDYLVTVLSDYVNAISGHYVPSWEKGKGRVSVPVPVAAEDAFRQEALNFLLHNHFSLGFAWDICLGY